MAVITGTGSLSAASATMSGVGKVAHVGVGTLLCLAATLASSGGFKSRTGELYASQASISGAGVVNHKGTGTLSASTATLAGVGNKSQTGELAASRATVTGIASHGIPGSANLIASDAVIEGAGDIDHKGPGSLVASSALIASLGNSVYPIVGTASLNESITGVFVANAPLTGTAFSNFVPTGSFRFNTAEQASLESTYEVSGYRPSIPVLVYVLQANDAPSVVGVPPNRNFLVSSAFAGISGNPFYDSGASADYIGTVVKPASGPNYYVFRRPHPYEVIWYVPGRTTYRYELDRDTQNYRWVLYKGIPERGWDDQYVGSIFDPDGIVTYYTKMMSALMWRWAYDTEILSNQLNPFLVSSYYLSSLGQQYGLTLNAESDENINRSLVANAVPSFKQKGVNKGVQIRLQALGYRAFVNEIWVNPTNPANATYFSGVPLNRVNQPSCSILGAGIDYYERPHGYHASDQTPYVLSSRLALYVNNQDGTPIDWASVDPALKSKLYTTLRTDILPVHVDIRHFGTSVPLVGVDDAERVFLSDSLTVTVL
jgi:Phage tail protein (Tail_P2_I)